MVETVNIGEAKARFSRLIARVEAGERLLVTQAQVEGIPIVPSDPAIARYDVDVIW